MGPWPWLRTTCTVTPGVKPNAAIRPTNPWPPDNCTTVPTSPDARSDSKAVSFLVTAGIPTSRDDRACCRIVPTAAPRCLLVLIRQVSQGTNNPLDYPNTSITPLHQAVKPPTCLRKEVAARSWGNWRTILPVRLVPWARFLQASSPMPSDVIDLGQGRGKEEARERLSQQQGCTSGASHRWIGVESVTEASLGLEGLAQSCWRSATQQRVEHEPGPQRQVKRQALDKAAAHQQQGQDHQGKGRRLEDVSGHAWENGLKDAPQRLECPE